MSLAVVVVFVTTYLLILPAFTLEADKADKMAGIRLHETSSDTVSGESADSSEQQSTNGSETDSGENGTSTDPDYGANKSITDKDIGSEAPVDTETDADDITDADIEPDNEDGTDQKLPEYKGEGYTISVEDPQHVLTEGTELAVSEITSDDKKYDKYCFDALEALKDETGADSESEPGFVRLYDIKLIADGQAIEPDDSVEVTITYDSKDKSNTGENALKVENEDSIYVVHFAEDEKTGEEQAQVLDRESTSFQIRRNQLEEASFEADSFSVYAIVDAPEPVEIITVQSLEELAEAGEEGFLLSVQGPKYFSSTPKGNGCLVEVSDTASAATWYFEPVEGQENQYLIYTMDGGVKRYIHQTSGNNIELAAQGTALTVSVAADGKFYIKHAAQDLWLQHSNGGGGIRFYTDHNNQDNSQIIITYADSAEVPDDPYGLNGKAFGIAYHDNSVTSAALTAEDKVVSNRHRLAAKETVMKPDVLDGEGVLLVAENSDIQFWTFESIGEDRYYITTEVDGQKKYLTVNGSEVTLSDGPNPNGRSVIRAVPGKDENAGKWHFTVNNYSLNFDNNVNNGFNAATGTGATTWLNLVTESVLDDDDFTTYKARKVSVSDEEQVYNGQKVVVYTRVWNEETKKYEFFVVDHNGNLLPCYDTGGEIEWLGSQVNTAEWEFTEYRNDDGTLNYYYELQNVQYGNFIAPQITGNQTMSDTAIGVNMDGRRYGSNYTSIIAWDDARYSYTGLKAENGKVVPCALAEADDFYFAVVVPVEEQDQLSTVKTIDNNEHGITMKMIDFNNPVVRNRDSGQTAVLGYDTNEAGLLSSDLKENGYPDTDPEKTGRPAASLAQLFDSADAVDANHLFIESTYNESGYFEYDSTQNFARFNKDGDGNFTVYDQLGAISDYTGKTGTGRHGQFLPYQDLAEGSYCDFTNTTDVLAQELPDTHTRKGEKLYNLGTRATVDYFFGMEMEASFTQTANGLDAWGHDIIFEFSGDDDFWLYVDGELVLDVGGTHAASIGNINFRTGEVTTILRNVNGGVDRQQHTTLRDIYESNYRIRNPEKTDAEVEEYLDGIFHLNSEGNYVFKDYTNHTMKMFYMERGAGASNLHMRFNLAAVKPGTVELSKKLSGAAENSSNNLIQFPYQIYYRTESDDENTFHLFGERAGENELVKYKDTTTSVTYKRNLNIAGTRYEHVFMLRPGERAVIDLPQDTVEYYFKECGVNTEIYEKVSANGDILTGTEVGERTDYAVDPADMNERPEVIYDNQVKEGTVRTLSISKKLYDTDGETELTYPDNKTLFSFRLYLGTEYVEDENLPLAYLYSYFVKDTEGNYCRWNSEGDEKGFVPISPAVSDYDELKALLDTMTAAQKEAVIFRTSPNGSISKIPAGYTVEVRDLVVGTKWKVEERDSEIPRGYALRLDDGYQRIDEGHTENTGTAPITGTIEPKDPDTASEEPHVLVSNQKGWGLTVKKIWSDKDFMESHGDIFFAVYVTPHNGNHERLVDDTVRILRTTDTDSEVYYFFDTLHVGNTRYNFDDFIIREVTLSGHYTVDPVTGKVSGYNSVHPIINQPLHVSGTPIGGELQDNIKYTVTYETGSSTGHNENVRIDTVTNSRPGIKIYKTEWDWETPLGGADFTIKDASGQQVIKRTYTSRESDGLVTIAYLEPGTYTLTETGVPKGYTAMDEPLTFTVRQNNHQIEMDENDFCKCTYEAHDHNDMAVITVRNRTAKLQAVKKDSSTGTVISGAHFALYKMVTDAHGNPRKDYTPMEGYEDLETDESGIIPSINMDNLNAGTYYLEETRPAPGYEDIDDICFTIDKDGKVTVDSGDHGRITSSTDNNGLLSYTLTVTNGQMKKVSFMKVDISDTDAALSGAEFDLYSITGEGDDAEETLIMSGLVSDDEGMLSLDSETVFALPTGTYKLTETDPPEGYTLREDPVTVIITNETDEKSIPFKDTTPIRGVTYDEGTSLSAGGTGMSYDNDTSVYTMKLSNTAGYELPSAGGIGTTIFYVIGTILLVGCGIILAARRRVNNKF